jgi:hypothetical protein
MGHEVIALGVCHGAIPRGGFALLGSLDPGIDEPLQEGETLVIRCLVDWPVLVESH